MKLTGCILLTFALAAQVQATTPDMSHIRAESQIWTIGMAAEDFQAEYGVLPPGDSWFEELSGASNAVINTRGVVFLEMWNGPDDPWEHPYQFRSPGMHRTNSVDVWSLGKDGQSTSFGNGPDDINNWNPEHPWRKHRDYRFSILRTHLFDILFPWALVGGLLYLASKQMGRIKARRLPPTVPPDVPLD